MWLSLLLPRRSPDRGSKPHADRRPTTHFRPRLEELEARWLPSQIGQLQLLFAILETGTHPSALQGRFVPQGGVERGEHVIRWIGGANPGCLGGHWAE